MIREAEPVSAPWLRQALANRVGGVTAITACGAAGSLGIVATSCVSVSFFARYSCLSGCCNLFW